MGNCKYCGEPAGLLSNKHVACEEQYLQNKRKQERQLEEQQRRLEEQQLRRAAAFQGGQQRIDDEILRAIKDSGNFDELEKMISDVPTYERKDHLIKGWKNAVEQFLEDGIIDTTEEKRLLEFQKRFALTQSDMDENGTYTRITKSLVLRDVLNGITPLRFVVDTNFPINRQKGEVIIWAFHNSDYYKDKTRREYVGRSQGISIRLMKGLYYRFGAFKGHPVESTERVHIDTGLVAITNRNIYFAGSKESLRIPYAKIVSFAPFSNGIGVILDDSNAKFQFFLTGDGWFTYNLVTNLQQVPLGYLHRPSVTKPFNPLK